MRYSLRNIVVPIFLLVAGVTAAGTVYFLREAGESVAPPVDTSLRGVLAQAEWVHVFRPQPKVEIPIAEFGPGANEDPTMFALLMKGTRLGAGKPPGQTDLVFAIRSREAGEEHGRVTQFVYDLETGRLGNGDEWGAAPAEFRKWMLRMDARVPKRDYAIVRSEGRKVVAPIPKPAKPGE